MIVIIRIAIGLGLVCAAVDFYATVAGSKTSLHRAAHLLAGLAFMGLAYMIWMIK